MSEIKIYIDKMWSSNSIQIWVIRHENNGDVFINIKDGELFETRCAPGELKVELKPFLELPWRFGDEFMKAISDFNSQNGIITENENLLKGKLQATELHLSDMRELTKKLTEWTITANDRY
jgi:hypothetical protein